MNVSLFRSIANQYKDLRGVNTVSMMNSISRLIENQIIDNQLPVNFYAGFERFSYFPSQLRRYSRLGAVCRRVYVFGVPDVRPPSIPGIEFLEISPSSPLAREWFLLVDTPDFWTTLLTQEVEGRDAITGGRRFDGIWSFDEQVVDRVSLLMSQVLETSYLPVAQRNPDSQSRHVADISGHLVSSLDTVKLTSQRRWRQITTLQKLAELSLQNKPLGVLLNDAAQVLHTIFGATDVAITLSDDSAHHTMVGTAGNVISSKQSFVIDSGPSATALSQGRLVQIDDMRQARDRDTCLPMALSICTAPLIGRSRAQGVVVIGSPKAGVWDEEDGRTVAAFANMLMPMIERSRLQKVLFDITRQQNK
ncbi:GAF domain-containing protein [Oscillochloris sp. ZM17-4]|uniref:DICT sensory domain-containing protein n=1 Tax=Oscillochloris sp. ZM17-4 TaxID=2866714 RepID=UPI001C73BE95|nr:DICT sensory domain-containing protein [Oscillochloris sp. ZM17-4]MBX0328282.1 GAF domain-containing protein [Oscillochloris sp. ZM17-4]